ncbi:MULTISPECIES: RNA-binding S4 domain-containing protein [unclassified Methylobacterium]|uniref:RNA-binding S4 domain-containing protein n=1 Tax=unclassified Methylobacterium TaxID=2615210 RepID=UPI0006F7F2A2|nr:MULTISPECIES: RNA-binding S4 domain-containing protein [unclassified Methylobacterium]KQP88927.1 RNA-binding protein [Methylobacterium sp. Leaf113]MCK2056406.1 RNA-binding S4 domain-containing protein [Methylobacterium sp. 37f]
MKPGRQRLDKWLWFARFARTRTLAARLVTDGYVRVNGQRAASAATAVGLGDVVTVAAAHATVIARIRDLGERRGPAPEAQQLYEVVGDIVVGDMPD